MMPTRRGGGIRGKMVKENKYIFESRRTEKGFEEEMKGKTVGEVETL